MDSLVIVALAVLAGASVQGLVGFGFALVVVPPMITVMPDRLPQVVLLLSAPMVAWLGFRERSAISVRAVPLLALGQLVGTIPAVLWLSRMSTETVQATVATLVLGGVILMASGSLSPRVTRGTLLATGGVSGFMGTIAGIDGPPLALLMSQRGAAETRSTLSAVFLTGTMISMCALAVAGRFDTTDIQISALLAAPLAIGLYVGQHLSRLVRPQSFRVAVLVLSAIASATILLRVIMQ